MQGLLVGGGLLLVLIIVVHLIFKVIKFTLSVFLLGLALLLVFYVFQQYLGIDLGAVIQRLIAG
jgi:hypothetical protein